MIIDIGDIELYAAEVPVADEDVTSVVSSAIPLKCCLIIPMVTGAVLCSGGLRETLYDL